MASRLMNEAPKWVVLIIWLLTNVGLFIGYFFYYYNGEKFFYIRKIVGLGLPFARGAAACLNFNCMLILLPVCRNLISFLRKSCTCCKRNMRRQLDKNITFHKYIAYMICLHTAIHAGAHCFNVEFFVDAQSPTINKDEAALLTALSSIAGGNGTAAINPVRLPNASPVLEALKLIAGVTGIVISLALIVMVSSSTDFIRLHYFEAFWFTHHLFIVFYIALVVHGIQGVVTFQENVSEHNPEKCSQEPLDWGKEGKCPVPRFQNGTAGTWKWVLAPMIFYFIERCIRFFRSQQKVTITKVIKHPSRVIELQMQKAGFQAEAGQYVFLHCPSISKLEWHPFTLTSAPEDDYFSLHIRLVGDWTNALAGACHADSRGDQKGSSKLPSIAVDGPFGTATEDVFRYQVDVFVGTGIGVTPFASVLKHIWHKCNNSNFETKLTKVYFYWICPDTNAFEWFTDLLSSLEVQMAEQGKADFLDYNIYLTRGWDSDQAKNIMLQDEEATDAVTGLQKKTNYGRPNWDHIFQDIAEQHVDTRIGVFFCGPKALSATLHKMSNRYSSPNPNGTHFVYNKENF